MGAVGVVMHINVALVISLMILLCCSYAWRCFDGSFVFHLLILIISTSSSSAICIV